jgi:hypothetical protein
VSSGNTNAGVQVLWEPDPVSAPGRFESFPGADLLVEQVNDLVKVREVGQPGTALSQDMGSFQDELSLFSESGDTNGLGSARGTLSSLPPLTCYPDGTSDSMEVVLTAASGEDKRLVVVTLWGLSGASAHKVVAAGDSGADLTGDYNSLEPWFEP